jgi:hypothetical protein
MKAKKSSRKEAEKSSGASKPVSFHPLTFEESLDALLSVEPPPKEQTAAPKKAAKKRTAKKQAN